MLWNLTCYHAKVHFPSKTRNVEIQINVKGFRSTTQDNTANTLYYKHYFMQEFTGTQPKTHTHVHESCLYYTTTTTTAIPPHHTTRRPKPWLPTTAPPHSPVSHTSQWGPAAPWRPRGVSVPSQRSRLQRFERVKKTASISSLTNSFSPLFYHFKKTFLR